jgi:2-heptyl-3-hydroxy-4(1H)-quinolone synthase
MDVIVTGAGIGGLTAALALSTDGHRVTLLERTAQFEAVGAGIVLAPNAVHVLTGLGLDLAPQARPLAATEVHTAAGSLLSRLDTAALARRYGPTYGLGRALLHTALADALPGTVEIIHRARVDSVDEQEDRVVVGWADQRRTADVLIAADGLHSAVRPLIGGPDQLRYSGTSCWRGIVTQPAGSALVEAWAQNTRVGVVPLAGDHAYYYLVLGTPPGTPAPATADAFRDVFAGYRGLPGAILDGLTAPPPLHHDLFELDRPFWGTPRVLMLGDAAHAMTPNQGQGAAMAIEDAAAVRLALRPGAAGALDRYRTLRHRRVRRVQLTSRRIGALSHRNGPVGAALRNATVRLTPPAAGARALRRLVTPGVRLAADAA